MMDLVVKLLMSLSLKKINLTMKRTCGIHGLFMFALLSYLYLLLQYCGATGEISETKLTIHL